MTVATQRRMTLREYLNQEDHARIPDITVLPEALWDKIADRAGADVILKRPQPDSHRSPQDWSITHIRFFSIKYG